MYIYTIYMHAYVLFFFTKGALETLVNCIENLFYFPFSTMFEGFMQLKR